ncbi:MAG: RNA polymerase sigma factor [Porcipelethomonas sp.]
MNEKKMIKQIRKKDTAAFEKLIDVYYAYVGTVIYNIIGTSMTNEDIEEVASDVFVEVWNNAEKLRNGKLKAFIGAVARNLARNKLRELREDISADENEYLLFDDNFKTEIDRSEKAEIINEALSCLSENERSIFIRFYYLGETTGIIADELGITVTKVTSCLSRGRRKMKKHLDQKNITM